MRLSLNMIGNSNDEINFPDKLSLPHKTSSKSS